MLLGPVGRLSSRGLLVSARRTVVVVAVAGIVAALLASGPAVAGAQFRAAHRSNGWRAVPAAARGAVERTLASTPSAPAIHSLEIADPHDRASDYFGTAVAVSGDLLLIGAPGNYMSSGIGIVYVFRRPASGWAHVKKVATLTPTEGVAGEQFGDGVAIDGSTVVVGAGYLTVDSHSSQGGVYIFAEPATGWHGALHESALLTASDGAVGDYLGYEGVAISGRVVTSAGSYHMVGTNSEQGEVYVWVEPKTGWSGTQHESAKLTANDGAVEDYLGYGAVAISGRTVAAAAGYHAVGATSDAGAVYVWNEPKAGWSGTHSQSAELTASNGAVKDYLGYESLAMSGGTVVAGAGYHPVATNANQGELYVWRQPKAGWSGTVHENARLVSSDGAASDYLGYAAAAISGNTIFATAPDRSVGTNTHQGAGYLFKEPKHGWSGTHVDATEMADSHGQADDYLGEYNATALSGTTEVAGEYDRSVGANSDVGTVAVFSPPPPRLTKLKQSHQSWQAVSRKPSLNPAHHPTRGTRFSFSLSEAGTVTLHFVRHGHPASTRTFTVAAPAGHSALYFFGQLNGHRMTKGKYTVTASDSNDAGVSTGHKLRFTLQAP
jgi:hypothetical protein